jgi:DNA-binding MarR family transcriptional regulator
MKGNETGCFDCFAKIDKSYQKFCGQIVAECGFTPNEIVVLMHLSANQDNNLACDIVKCRNISKGLIAKSVESLCQKGYVTTGGDEKDRRLVHLYLTDKSRPLVERIKACRQTFIQKLHKGIPAEDLDTLLRVTQKMNQNLNDML